MLEISSIGYCSCDNCEEADGLLCGSKVFFRDFLREGAEFARASTDDDDEEEEECVEDAEEKDRDRSRFKGLVQGLEGRRSSVP